MSNPASLAVRPRVERRMQEVEEDIVTLLINVRARSKHPAELPVLPAFDVAKVRIFACLVVSTNLRVGMMLGLNIRPYQMLQ